MAEGRLTKSVDQVDIFVTVNVPYAGALGSVGNDWKDHFLPVGPETRRCPGVGKTAPVFLGERLGPPVLIGISRDEFRQELLLHGRELGSDRLGTGPVEPDTFGADLALFLSAAPRRGGLGSGNWSHRHLGAARGQQGGRRGGLKHLKLMGEKGLCHLDLGLKDGFETGAVLYLRGRCKRCDRCDRW